jgi:hypothetical protein
MTKRRILGWMLVLLFVFGGAAACSDDDGDDGGDSDSTEEDSGDSGGGESGNAEVEDYCDAADDFAAQVEDFDITDPSSGDAAELSSTGQELATQAADLGGSGLDQADAERVTECSEVVTDAAAGLAG